MTPWHYEHNGQRLGPVTEAQMAKLVQQRVIGGSTLVWAQGHADWQPLERTALAAHLSSPSTPPPLPGSRVPNDVIWVLAVAPLLGLVLESLVAGALAPSGSLAEEAVLVAIASGTYWYFSLALNVGLSLLDDWRLKRAGVDTATFGKVAFLVPVYLWKRSKALGQRPVYFWIWLATFVFALLSAVGAEEELQANRGSGSDAALAELREAISKPVDVAALSKAPETMADVPVRVIQVRDNQVTTVGGELLAATEDGSAVGPKVLVLKGMKLNGLTNDLVTLLTVYRYTDRDVVLLTHGCGGSACSYTSIAVMDITAQGAPMLFQHDELTIAGDGQEPEVKVQPDGSLLVSFEGFKGRQTWRYAQRELVRL